MWGITISLVIVLTASATLAVPTRNERVSDRSLRIGGSSSVPTTSDTSSNGFSLSFVPLFSLLANFIPRILSRFNGVNAYKARSLENPSANSQTKDESMFCSPTHLGPWPNLNNCRQFYVCQLNSNCSIATSGNEVLTVSQDAGDYVHIDTLSTNCTTIKIFQCQGASVYNPSTHMCEAEVNSSIVCKQRDGSIQNIITAHQNGEDKI